MKSCHALPGTIIAFACFLAGAASTHAQLDWPGGIYTPDSLAEIDRNRWSSYELPNHATLWANVWAPWNTTGKRIDAAGWPMPMRMWTTVHDVTKRHWEVVYDVVGEAAKDSPYRSDHEGISWVKAFPHIQDKPAGLFVSQAGEKILHSEWTFGAESTDWANHRFNAIWEIRLGRVGSDGKGIPDSGYIIQLEVMQARYGNPERPSVALSGYDWTPGIFTTYGNVPVYKFILAGAGVSENTARTVALDLLAFAKHTASLPETYSRAHPDAQILEVNAGIEVCDGTDSRFWTTHYAVDVRNR